MKKIFLYEKEVAKILEKNDDSAAKEMYNRVIYKLDSLGNRMNKITLYLIICVCVYPLVSTKELISVSIGPFGLNNFDLIAKSIPIVFAYLCFEYALTGSHQRQLSEVSKQLIAVQYKDYPEEEVLAKGNYTSFLANILLPFTLISQLSRLVNLKGSIFTGVMLLILLLPLIIIYFTPLLIEIYLLSDQWQKTQGDLWSKVSIIISIWFFILLAVYYKRHSEHNILQKKEDTTT